MANDSIVGNKHQRLLAAVALIIVVVAFSMPAASAKRVPVRLHFYMHEISSGPGQTAVKVVNGPMPNSKFGETTVVDDFLTEGPGVDSKVVGRAQGSYVRAGSDPALIVTITVKLTDGPYNGSSIVIIGQDFVFDEVRELAVVGGTGQLRRASGHVVWTTAYPKPSPEHLVLELDVHASVPATTAARNIVTSDAAGTEENNVE